MTPSEATHGTVIVGGGPAGTAAAITLARGGAPVLLLERTREDVEKVCGEFLGGDAAAALAGLGIDLAALGAVPLRRACFAAGTRQGTMALPFPAWSLPRLVLDAALLDAAARAGAEIRRGVAVAAAEPDGPGWRLRLAEGGTIRCARLVLATGKHELRGLGRGVAGGAVGVKLALEGAAVPAAIALLACRGGYAGLQPRGGGQGGANLCAAFAAATPGLAALARDPAALLAHVAAGSRLAREVLGPARPASARPLTVAGVPYGFLHGGGGAAGVYRVGDQAAVIPSLCGDGIAMALGSGRRAAAAILGGQPAEAHHAGFRAAVGRGMRVARLADGAMARAPGALAASVRWMPGLAAWAASRTRLGVV